MTIPPELVQMLRALLSGQFDAVATHVGQAEGGVRLWDAVTGLLNAAFWLAVDRRFDPDADQEITEYVTTVCREHPEAEPRVAEALIKAALGEEQLVAALDPEATLPVQMVLLHRLIADRKLTDDQLEEFLSETVRLAEHNLSQRRI
ncbi:MAG: hypothetical protein ACRDT8_14060 [Micromonosporaceae bacterium]